MIPARIIQLASISEDRWGCAAGEYGKQHPSRVLAVAFCGNPIEAVNEEL